MKKLLMILSVVALFFISSQPANSMCVHNKTATKFSVCFYCGTFCTNLWEIAPGDSRCRYDKDGTITNRTRRIQVSPTSALEFCGIIPIVLGDGSKASAATLPCTVKVEPHGWMNIVGDVNQVEDGELASCLTFK